MAKKVQKVSTPIDHRETFVSIQKSFADSDMSVAEKLKVLYTLQQIDIEIDKIIQLRGELPLEVQSLEAEIEERKVKVAAVAAQIEEFTRRIAEFKNQIVEYQSTSDKYKSQVDHVANSREYDSLSKEIENLDLLIQIADKNIFETKEAIANKRMELEELKERLAVREDDLAAKKEELETIVASTAAEEEKLVEQRNKVESKLDERTVCAYDHIRNSNLNHLAVVAVYNGDSCGGCFSTIAPQRLVDIASNKKMIVCEYCGRILMNPEQ